MLGLAASAKCRRTQYRSPQSGERRSCQVKSSQAQITEICEHELVGPRFQTQRVWSARAPPPPHTGSVERPTLSKSLSQAEISSLRSWSTDAESTDADSDDRLWCNVGSAATRRDLFDAQL